MKLEKRDYQILEMLQQDCRLPNAELAQKAGMSPSSCWRRIRALEQSGIITRYGAIVDPAGMGYGFHAIVHVQLTRHNPDRISDFIAAVRACPEVQECYATTGQSDYHLRVLCADMAAYNRFLDEFLFRQPGVQSVQTNVVLQEIKSNGILGAPGS